MNENASVQERRGSAEDVTSTASPPDTSASMEKATPSSPALPARNMSPLAWLTVLIALLSSTFLFALDNTVVADVQPQIIESLGEIDKLPWVSVNFALGALSTSLVWGKCYGMFTAKAVFIVSVVLFEIGSAVCGAAPTMNAMIVGRAICGVGGIGIYIGAMNLVSILTSVPERPMYLSLVALTWGLGTVLGPVVGGAFAISRATWRWSFYINLCVGGAACPVYLFLLPARTLDAETPFLKKLQSIDYLGTVLSVGASVSGTMAISFGGSLYGWRTGQIIGLFCCSGLLWILFTAQQSFQFLTSGPKQLFPTHMVKSWEMCIFFAETSAAITTAFIPIYFIPLAFQFTHGSSALEAGVRLLPFVLPEIAAVITNGSLMAKFGWYMPWYLLGGTLCVVGSALLYTTDLTTNAGRIYGYSVILGVGSGAYSQASFAVVQAKNEPQLVPDAVAFVTTGQLLGLTLALAISNTLFLNTATQGLQKILPTIPRSTLQASISGAETSFFQTLPGATQTAFLQVVLKAINETYILVIVAGALSVILAITMKRERLFVQ